MACFQVGSTVYLVDGKQYLMDVAPYLKNDRVYLPLRYAARAVGVGEENVIWDTSSRSAILLRGNLAVKLVAGSQVMYLNGQPVVMDASPEIVGGRMMLPLKWLACALGVPVTWDSLTHTVWVGAASPQLSRNGYFEVPSLRYPPSVAVVSRDFTWQFEGRSFSWHVEVPLSLLEWSRSMSKLTEDFYSATGRRQALAFLSLPAKERDLILAASEECYGDLVPWVREEANYTFAGFLAERLVSAAQAAGFDRLTTAQFVLSFVQSIPYQEKEPPQLPVQTLIDNGDCDCKAVLAAALLHNLGYRVALLFFPSPPGKRAGHLALGIAFSPGEAPELWRYPCYLGEDGRTYYYAETTEEGWLIGEIPPPLTSVAAYLWPVDRGPYSR
ncbi:copper amine oxidase N-terminal domain-containing protein [Ammonifex thiophilus]|uniref:copper amine oxidase N-terminal domain-containing protein n=1 Tax=Ammonifex thiophilus TaxID=444093 RepID=UPI00196B7068|nr:copper amine oxidase N-terminal domain-containing protein [Ammonifex thiophilus]